MDKDITDEWIALGEELQRADPAKFDEVKSGLRDVIEAQRILARYDWQLMFRGRPQKRYTA